MGHNPIVGPPRSEARINARRSGVETPSDEQMVESGIGRDSGDMLVPDEDGQLESLLDVGGS